MIEKQKLFFSRRLNDADAGFFFLGQRPECNVAMIMLGVLKREIPFDEALAALTAAAEEVPRFKDFLRPAPLNIAPPMWVPKADFEVREQIRQVRMPAETSWDDALRIVDELQAAPFPAGAPPWEILFVNGMPGGRSLMVMKVHHALSDGMALSLLFAKAFGGDFLAKSGVEVVAEMEEPPGASRWRVALAHQRAATKALFGRLAETLVALPRSAATRRREIEAIRQLLWPAHRLPPGSHGRARRLSGFRVPIEVWNTAAGERGGSANDLYLAIVGNAIRRHFVNWDLEKEPLQTVMPVNLRGSADVQDAGNMTGVGVVELGGRFEDIENLSEIRKRTQEVKRSAADAEPSVVDELVLLLPGRIRSSIQFREFATKDVVASNVPMPIPGELCSVPFEMMFMVAPTIGASVSFTLTSYGDHFYLALNADRKVIAGPFEECLFAVLRDVFGELAQDLTSDDTVGANAAL